MLCYQFSNRINSPFLTDLLKTGIIAGNRSAESRENGSSIKGGHSTGG